MGHAEISQRAPFLYEVYYMGKYDELFVVKTAAIELMDAEDVSNLVDPMHTASSVSVDDIPGVRFVKKLPSAVANMGNSLVTMATMAGKLPVAAGEAVLDAGSQAMDATVSGIKNAYRATANAVTTATPYVAGGIGATGAGILALSKANDLNQPKPYVYGGISSKTALKALLALVLAGGAHSMYQNYQDRAKAKQELSNNA